MFRVNQPVLVWIDGEWYSGEVVRVYDEDTYEAETYGNDVPSWCLRSKNLSLYDVLTDKGFTSKAHFEHGLKKVTADPPYNKE